MSFLGTFIVILIVLFSWNWSHDAEWRCEIALRQMQSYDMCRIMDECDIDQGSISWNLYWYDIAGEDCNDETDD